MGEVGHIQAVWGVGYDSCVATVPLANGQYIPGKDERSEMHLPLRSARVVHPIQTTHRFKIATPVDNSE